MGLLFFRAKYNYYYGHIYEIIERSIYMKTNKRKNVYRLAVETVVDSIRYFKTWKAIKLLFGKRNFESGIWRFRGTLVDYIKFCRINSFAICITGREFL